MAHYDDRFGMELEQRISALEHDNVELKSTVDRVSTLKAFLKAFQLFEVDFRR